MKNHIFSIGLLAALAISCSIHEMDFKDAYAVDEFYASIENTDAPDTKVYATEELYLRWNADDRITIFNKYTYNQEYRFTGETGDNSGSFKRVDNGDFVTGNSLENIYAIYPYLESTRVNDTGVITVTLPAEQRYAENTMGLGANTMISTTTDNQLLFKNVGGYLMLKLYGDNVTVSSISLKGNNGERIAGKATVSMPINGVPTVAMSETAGQEITLICDTPVKIGSTAETATTFWIVVPPTVFSKGFTLTVKDNKNGIFEKSTSKSFEISRNKLARMSALEAIPELPTPSDDAIVFADEKVKAKLVAAFDTNGDGELSYKEAAAVISGDDLKNAFGSIKTYKSFDEFQFFVSVSSIPESFFSSWNKLSSIVIPSSVISIGNYAFKDCINLSNINLPNNLSYLGNGVFAGCTSLTSIIIPDSVSGTLGLDFNPEHDNPYRFNGDGVFEGCTSLEEVTLSKHITSLGVWAFHDCHNLETLVIPESVIRYNIGTFEGCEKLKTIPVPQSMTIIPKYLFWGCTHLSNVSLPDHCLKIGAYAFASCQSITSLTIPETVTTIETGAFSGCESMTTINIPESISIIEAETFRGCGVTSIAIPESVTSIGNNAFSQCEDLVSLIIPDSVMSIGHYAFYGCTSLESASIPESVQSLGAQVFQSCSNLSSISIPNKDIELQSTFKNCVKISEVSIPSKVLLFSTFENCVGLQSVVFSEGRESIGSASFKGCSSIKTITIPKDVVYISAQAFSECSGLESIRIEAVNPPSGAIQMFYSTNNCPIYVPAGSIDAYKSAQYWSDYADRIQAIPSIPIPEAVDLGLSVKWASFNLGASKPEEYGDYYAWGETEPYYSSLDPLTWKEGKEAGYAWSSYKWCMGDYNTMTKYCYDSYYGYNGFTDTKTVLDPEDDAVNVNLGGSWRMPTDAEWTELINSCTWTWTTQNGVDGRLVTASNGNSIFLPAAGNCSDTGLFNGGLHGSYGVYWSSSLGTDNTNEAYRVYFNSSTHGRYGYFRCPGFSIRPVYAE